MIQCMGGWCAKRSECAHYWAAPSRAISERLCDKAREEPEPMRRPIPIQTGAKQ
jgi:hypothetical protein